jgi:hypothetical protein
MYINVRRENVQLSRAPLGHMKFLNFEKASSPSPKLSTSQLRK